MFRALLIAVSMFGGSTLAGAAAPSVGEPSGVVSHGPACGPVIRHVSLVAEAQMCPRPLATTVIAPPRHRLLHT